MDGGAQPSTYERPSRRAPVRPVGESPAVDATGPGFVVTTSGAPIVHFSAARARLLALASAERRRVALLTSGSARLTRAMHEGLQTFGGAWVVHTEAGLRDADSGRRYADIADVVRAPGAGELAREHAEVGFDGEIAAILDLSVVVRHRGAATARYGDAVHRLAGAFLDEPAIDWGIREPIATPWEDDAPGELLRRRAGQASALLVTGGDDAGRRFVGSIRVRPDGAAADEVISLHVRLGAPNDPATADGWLSVAESFTELAEVDGVLNATAMASFGPGDLSIWPWLQPPPIPVALLVGSVGVARFGVDARRAAIEEHFAAEFVGAARRPALVVELGERPHTDNASELAALVGVLGPEATTAGLGTTAPVALFGADWQATTRAAAASRLGVEPGELDRALGIEVDNTDDPVRSDASEESSDAV